MDTPTMGVTHIIADITRIIAAAITSRQNDSFAR
jgi:hypothetical protein